MKEQEKKEAQPQSVFAVLNAINVNEHTEIKDNGTSKLTYLSWTWAWQQVKSLYPDANYEVRHWDGVPYFYEENLGYMVETSVTINGETMTMWLPVMDSKNKAMKAQPYTYKTKYGDKWVEAATMFDINTTIMRCLVKNLAMFGLGLYIYAGEDLPEDEAKQRAEETKKRAEEAKKRVEEAKRKPKTNVDNKTLDEVADLMRKQTSMEEVGKIFKQYPTYATELTAVGAEMRSVLAS